MDIQREFKNISLVCDRLYVQFDLLSGKKKKKTEKNSTKLQ